MAPSSQLAKRKCGDDENTVPSSTTGSSDLLKSSYFASSTEPRAKRACVLNGGPQRVALSPAVNRFHWAPDNRKSDEIACEVATHDDFIQKILKRPFKVPIANYVGRWKLLLCSCSILPLTSFSLALFFQAPTAAWASS